MDAADYETNTLLIVSRIASPFGAQEDSAYLVAPQNNISSVAFRIYEPVAAPSSTYTFAVSDVENALRSGGHLVYANSLHRGIWCFLLVANDGSSVGTGGGGRGAAPGGGGGRRGRGGGGAGGPV